MSAGQDPLFKGCTRPAMLFGVPVVPLAVVSGGVLLLSLWLSILLALGLLPLFFVMRGLAQSDDQKFRLLWLKLYFRLIHYNHTRRFWRSSHYRALNYIRRK
jgi:type IV secretion system protein VirB3